ncbi:hypothetical protein [Mesorhizobium sp.]|uniref:hypothetical protein n=2 Tax=Mesorhizobium sp. TaxID=1871066 RepID=UPI0025E6B0BF|nr:hypothetical protein [Mesorhizobium sp.]
MRLETARGESLATAGLWTKANAGSRPVLLKVSSSYSSKPVFDFRAADFPVPRFTFRRIMPKSAPPVPKAVMK